MVSFILGVVLLGEAVTPIKVGGVVMIIIGIWALKTG
jgi:multidrug transporter EmrE-like cation transporter